MAQTAVVPFAGASLPTVRRDGVVSVAMKPVAEALGLNWQSQYKRLRRHPVLATSVVIMTTEVRGSKRVRDQVFLPIAYLNGWLFGIDTRRVRPELRDTLIAYQRECFIALDDYWRGGGRLRARLSEIEAAQAHHDGIGKRRGERFAEERARFEKREGVKLLVWAKGTRLLSRLKLKSIEELDTELDDKLLVPLISLGFDLNYILYGKRMLTDAERHVRNLMRRATPKERVEMLAHAETIAAELVEQQDALDAQAPRLLH